MLLLRAAGVADRVPGLTLHCNNASDPPVRLLGLFIKESRLGSRIVIERRLLRLGHSIVHLRICPGLHRSLHGFHSSRVVRRADIIGFAEIPSLFGVVPDRILDCRSHLQALVAALIGHV